MPRAEHRPAGLRIAIVGAESTGKTTLAQALAEALVTGGSTPAPRVALVGETLREWCHAAGRTPRHDEQLGILLEHHRRIDEAALMHDVVVADTTALMTHVYSDLLFGDASLRPAALERHRTMDFTLLTALDLPWMPDGHQRDGEHVRVPVDERLRAVLLGEALPFAVIAGRGPARLAQALAALASLPAPASPAAALRPRQDGVTPAAAPRGAQGLFTALAGTGDDPPRGGTARGERRREWRGEWRCDCCVPEAEQALHRR